uniref:Uncharacterized protein n=1 Tax=viral metagenome TaxID=1070528 RepID=A0A6M3Y0L9_9ZZZZ
MTPEDKKEILAIIASCARTAVQEAWDEGLPDPYVETMESFASEVESRIDSMKD